MSAKIIGLTGGIGSGKTTIANYFAQMGIPVYIADDEANKILLREDVVQDLVEAFGRDVADNGIPDRKKIAAIVFNDKEKLTVLNSIVHPRVNQNFKLWLSRNCEALFVIKEAAILFESGSYKQCDKIILVTAPLEKRLERVMARDGALMDDVLKRINNQWDDEQKRALSDFVINNENLEEAKIQADKIVKELQKI